MARQSGGKGLRQFLNTEQQREWLEGNSGLPDVDERTESLEQRFRYVDRFQKFLRRPQADDVLGLLRLYAERCIPVPRQTERSYWSVSCLPSTSDKPLVRVNASWMELFTLYADGEDVRARFIVHLSDFTTDRTATADDLDEGLLERSVVDPNDISCTFPNAADLFVIKVRGSASIRAFLTNDRALRGIRNFNLTYMNRGRNAYQASHCHSLADHMLDG